MTDSSHNTVKYFQHCPKSSISYVYITVRNHKTLRMSSISEPGVDCKLSFLPLNYIISIPTSQDPESRRNVEGVMQLLRSLEPCCNRCFLHNACDKTNGRSLTTDLITWDSC